jgi:hypothetical protein
MKLIHHNPAELFPPYRGYVHAAEIVGATRLAPRGIDSCVLPATRDQMEAGDRGGSGRIADRPQS